MNVSQNNLYFPFPVQPNQVVEIVVAYGIPQSPYLARRSRNSFALGQLAEEAGMDPGQTVWTPPPLLLPLLLAAAATSGRRWLLLRAQAARVEAVEAAPAPQHVAQLRAARLYRNKEL
jgi:hypothetical protein